MSGSTTDGGTAGHRALQWRVRPERPGAAVLVLHGGEERNLSRPGLLNLPLLRMHGFLRALRTDTAGADVAIGTVRYRHRGWNDERADAARDALAALDDLAEELGPVPTVLVGHSMGGRAALAAGGHPNVTGLVALAPWCPREEPCEHLADRDVLMLHGDRDKVTPPADTRAFAARSRAAGARVCGYTVTGSGHAMLQRIPDWHRATARLATALLGLRDLPAETVSALALPSASREALTLPLPRQPRTFSPVHRSPVLPTDV
ncbi:alpha/beta fold hydrolase [Streptomyces kaniharaensis]|uniref:Alpha/beta fold hydrolase n=1 Tax=Streptomyces kaniharaensis TaxID=212423 RepID=A0A6N7L1Y7_9ACTN|nr:alpha/beta fold hydrolase [Streptomyces kaniharaensis]MQS15803.1 alpha/beta fold hydrolase [Streptomyces kaniharaensis]